MNKESTGHDFAVLLKTWSRGALGSRCVRLGLVAAAGVSLALSGPEQPLAQQRYKEPTVTVTGVSTSGNVVSISADGSLGHAQTWQDPDGKFHVVLVNGQVAPGAARGVRTERVGNSLELVVPVKRGANVTVQPRGNRLDLVVTGGALNVENFPVEQQQPKPERNAARTPPPPREAAAGEAPERVQQSKAESRHRGAAEPSAAEPAQPSPVQSSAPAPPPVQAQAPAQPNAQADMVNVSSPPPPSNPVVAQPAAVKLETAKGEGLLSYLLSLPSLFAVVGVGLAGSVGLFVRRRRSDDGVEEGHAAETKKTRAEGKAGKSKEKPFEQSKGDRRKSDITVPFERRKSGSGAEDEATRRGREMETEASARQERAAESKSHAAAPAFLYGSYRIDQEVASLVAGGPHSIEVLASRAADDRRAVETSLLKALRAPETDADGRRRARTALEDYGFVARACAALLLGGETFERVSAACALGDMRSTQALPFLTEALYDADPLVRTECVKSLGALGLPSAIGALLDVARRHQDMSTAVLGPALTACSVESLELDRGAHAFAHTQLDSQESYASGSNARALVPAADYEELPESCDDEALSAALVRIESTDTESRVNAAQHLAQFQVRRAVAALAQAARHDREDAVRSAAVNSLGLINHESVFAHVIMALADEAREVRAAAARALSRLNFERAEAYVRVAETADARMLQDVAHACVKAGLAAQAVGRLASEDRRQAYEAFSLLSLCVGGGELGPVLDAIGSHRDDESSLTCVQLLGDSLKPEVCERLRDLAAESGMPERVRRSILETVGRVRTLEAV
ncbi:MAG: HEAT repeat domain-containing protein [Acidobacteria bacterium]|nr:HEAT repeat domain-containing protein [Acidobacteriota bacterium]